MSNTQTIGKIVEKSPDQHKLNVFLALYRLSLLHSEGYSKFLEYVEQVVDGRKSSFNELSEQLKVLQQITNYAERLADVREAHPSEASLIAIEALLFGMEKAKFEALVAIVDPSVELDPSADMTASIERLTKFITESNSSPFLGTGILGMLLRDRDTDWPMRHYHRNTLFNWSGDDTPRE